MKPFNTLQLTLVLILPLLSGCAKPAPVAETPIKVKAVKVSATAANSAFYYSGTIEAGKDIPLAFQTMGTVSKVLAREGERVKAGQLLAELDCQNNTNALRIAESKALQAADALKRFEPMYKNGNLAEIKMVEIRTNKTDADLSVKLAAKSVTDCSLTAPESGVISGKAMEPGESALPGKTVMKMVVINNVFATISVPEQEIGSIKPGMIVEADIPSAEQQQPQEGVTLLPNGSASGRLRGTVTDSGVTANPLARTYTVRILLGNARNNLLPGMICNVYVPGKHTTQAAIVPGTAIKLDENGNQFVYVIGAGNRVRKQPVQSSGFRDGGIVVTGGLANGDIIVREGAQKLTDNKLVEAEF